MNHLTAEERAELYEAAQRLHDNVGGGVEQWMVSLQQARETWSVYKEAVEVIGDAVRALVHSFPPAINELARMIQDLSDQMEAPPPQPLCPSHRTPLKGGRCPRCDKIRYMVSQRPGGSAGRR